MARLIKNSLIIILISTSCESDFNNFYKFILDNSCKGNFDIVFNNCSEQGKQDLIYFFGDISIDKNKNEIMDVICYILTKKNTNKKENKVYFNSNRSWFYSSKSVSSLEFARINNVWYINGYKGGK